MSPVAARSLVEMISKTVFAASADETRQHLCGVLLEAVGGQARMVASDGHRLAKVERAWKAGPEVSPAVLVPRRGVLEIRRMLDGLDGDVELGLHQGYLFLRADGAVLSIKLTDAEFPPYDRVIPSENDRVLVVARQALLDALRRVSLVASDRTWGVRLDLDKGSVRVASDNPDLGRAHETIEAQYDGEPFAIGFNSHYLIELLAEMGAEQVRAELAGELDAALFRPASTDDYLGVVMPMRV
jgi:DNA polymerase-3 subunit beta